MDHGYEAVMLILTRKPSQTICIGNEIEVVILGVKGQQVRIGVSAPKDVEVDRSEIRDRKMDEREDRNS